MSGFSERLSALRRGAGMTQAELAKKARHFQKFGKHVRMRAIVSRSLICWKRWRILLQVDMNVLLGRGEPLVNNDPELTAYLEALRDRPEMRALFRLSQKCHARGCGDRRDDPRKRCAASMRIPDYYVRFVDFPPTVARRDAPERRRHFPYTSTPASAMTRGAKRCGTSSSTWRGTTFTATLRRRAGRREARGETVSAVPPAPERGTVRCYRDLAALTTHLRSLGALGSSMESLGAEPMR